MGAVHRPRPGTGTSGQNGQVSDGNGAIQAEDAAGGGTRREHEVAGAGAGDGVFRVCFVCTGNICRSPMAEVVLRRLAAGTVLADGTPLVERLDITSAGTGNWHAGEPMDPRARAALARRGYQDHGHVARAFETAWFDASDLVVCLDRGHQQTLVSLARGRAGDDRYLDHLVMLRSFDPAGRRSGGRARSLLRRRRRVRGVPGPGGGRVPGPDRVPGGAGLSPRASGSWRVCHGQVGDEGSEVA